MNPESKGSILRFVAVLAVLDLPPPPEFISEWSIGVHILLSRHFIAQNLQQQYEEHSKE